MVRQHADIREAAADYISRGWYPIPLQPRSKALKFGGPEGGLQRVYTPDDFDPGDNIGVYLVPAQDKDRLEKLVAVDFDCREADQHAIWEYLPRSIGWGRASKPVSQVLYVAHFDKMVRYEDHCTGAQQLGATLLEIRVGHHSMCPPSTHPCGEVLRWLEHHTELLHADTLLLARRARLLATHCMLVRYYPAAGLRHAWWLKVAGLLRNTLGAEESEAEQLVHSVTRAVGDPEGSDRLAAVGSTYARAPHEEQEGAGKLADLMGADGEKFVATLRRFWDQREKQAKGRHVLSRAYVVDLLGKMNVGLQRDTFTSQLMIQNGAEPQPLDDAAVVKTWFQMEDQFGVRPDKSLFYDVLLDEAHRRPYHPVREYLDRLRWDGVERAARWLVAYGGAEDSPYTRAVGLCVLVAAVRRVRRPGCKFDELLVLESGQGWNKSTALQALCPKEDWFATGLPLGADAKIIIERTAGRWIIEVAELMGSQREVEHIKESLSRQVDGPVRLAYGRLPVAVPRQFVVIGTTNEKHYLRDRTGNRRFWPVPVREFDVEKVAADRDQLWAEAALREARGESTRLNRRLWGEAGQRQEERLAEDPWEAVLEDLVRGDERERQRYPTEQLWAALNVPVERRDVNAGARVAAAMRRLGFGYTTVKVGTRAARGWGRDWDAEGEKWVAAGR